MFKKTVVQLLIAILKRLPMKNKADAEKDAILIEKAEHLVNNILGGD